MSEVKKVVLAYSDGLDTSIIIPWLKEHYNNCEVIAVCGNVGQKGELEGLEERAKASGASKLYIEDLTDEFVEDYVIPTMQAGADYEGYLLGTSFARPILAKRVVEIARAEGADAVCHGSTGKGNDQVRFELAITFGELVYDGQWFSPLRKALSAFVTSTQEHVTGKVRLELYKGNLINAGAAETYVVTEIEDGRRVPAEVLKHIFEKYTDRPVLAKQQIADAWTRAVKSKTEQGKMYCLGSLYLAGMIKREILQPGS